MTSPKMSFPEGVKVPGPQIVGTGKVQFNRQGSCTVTFLTPVDCPFVVAVCGNGDNGGALARASTVFTVRDCGPHGFTIYADDNNCRQEVSYVAVSL